MQPIAAETRERLSAMSAAPHDISDVRKAWKEANLAPLWENAKAHRPAPPPDAGYLWSWDKIRPLITAAIEAASPHHECVAVRARRIRRVHHRRRQAVSDGGGRPDPHPGLDLARTRASREGPDHLARRPRRAVPAIYGHRRVPARAGRRDAGDRRRRRVRR